jgi:hypothetical protein
VNGLRKDAGLKTGPHSRSQAIGINSTKLQFYLIH